MLNCSNIGPLRAGAATPGRRGRAGAGASAAGLRAQAAPPWAVAATPGADATTPGAVAAATTAVATAAATAKAAATATTWIPAVACHVADLATVEAPARGSSGGACCFASLQFRSYNEENNISRCTTCNFVTCSQPCHICFVARTRRLAIASGIHARASRMRTYAMSPRPRPPPPGPPGPREREISTLQPW